MITTLDSGFIFIYIYCNTIFYYSDAEKIRDGISEKVGHFIYLVIGFIITVGISFAYGWKLTLAVSAYIPIVIVLNYFVAKVC